MNGPGALRALLWLGACAAMLAGTWLGAAGLDALAALLALLGIGIFAPPALRAAVAMVGVCAGLALWLGGSTLLFELLAPLIAALVGWIFARTLLPGRRPLIARAVATIDGEDWLRRPAVARYARRLTLLWAAVQALLALVGCIGVLHSRGIWPSLPWPSPRLYAAVILPGVVASLFVAEFCLRRMLLPQAPRHRPVAFVAELARAWPRLLE